MINSGKAYPWAFCPELIFSLIGIFISGCDLESDSRNFSEKVGPKFFTMPSSAQLNSAASQKLAKNEDLVLIEPGEFLMGSPENEVGRSSNEKRNRVQISQPFWIKKFEVTREDWNAIVPPDQKQGEPVFGLTAKFLKDICASSGYANGDYSVSTYQGTQSLEIYFEEAVFADGFWSTAKKPRNYKVNPQKFKQMEALLEFLNSQNIVQKGRLNQLHPVSRVSYSQAVAYCWEKTQRGRMNRSLPTSLVYRLPTEAEWEYACRAGSTGICGLGDGDFLSGENANIDGSMRGYIIDNRPKSEFSDGLAFVSIFRKGFIPIQKKAPVYPPNAWGLHDMHGNVLEWCYDFYGPYPEGNHTRVDPIGPVRGVHRIVRGGSFVRSAHESRSAKRLYYEASYRGSEIGFRYVLGLPLR